MSQKSPSAQELSLLEGMLPNQDWSMLDRMTVMEDEPEYVDNFGTVLLDSLGMLGLNTVGDMSYPLMLPTMLIKTGKPKTPHAILESS